MTAEYVHMYATVNIWVERIRYKYYSVDRPNPHLVCAWGTSLRRHNEHLLTFARNLLSLFRIPLRLGKNIEFTAE